MREDIHLFIGNREIEFIENPDILFNYKTTDMTNPTVVCNGYSKTITIIGTPNNNKVFGEIWNLERLQYYDGTYDGSSFNPLQKTDFVLYINGDIYESGYVKLTGIRVKGNDIQYDLSLYAGLGDFFAQLEYILGTDDELAASKKTLADLKFDEEATTTLDFNINKDSIFDAWQTINGASNASYSTSELNSKGGRPNSYLYDDRWNIINFAPCYNGYPNDFDSNKVIVDTSSISTFKSAVTIDEKTYTTVNNYLVGETNENLTEWETRDLRSYLMRPVINFSKIIEACGKPENNGGYELKLDETFFKWNNPYYADAWVTLPMLRDLDIAKTSTSSIVTGATINRANDNWWDIVYTGETFTSYNNVSMTLSPKFSVPIYGNDTLYLSYAATNPYYGRIEGYEEFGAVIFQVIAYDAINNEVGESPIYFLHSKISPNMYNVGNFQQFQYQWDSKGKTKTTDIIESVGRFEYDGFDYVWYEDGTNSQKSFEVSIMSNEGFDHLRIKMLTPKNIRVVERSYDDQGTVTSQYMTEDQNPVSIIDWVGVMENTEEAYAQNRVYGSNLFGLPSFNIEQSTLENFFSNTKITKKALLTTETTPCRYLIDYCKLFGLYFYRDPAEKSDDETTYPKGVIHIMTRDNFYNKKIVNLEEYIDHSKDRKITPQVAINKWYNFGTRQVETDAGVNYKNSFGYQYGTKRINTNYNFDNNTNDIYKENVFQGVPTVLEKDKYYNKPVSGTPVYYLNGFTYQLFNSGETTDIQYPASKIPRNSINPDGLEDYDLYPKPQCHKKNNEPSSGENILLFLNKFIESDDVYYITDDDPIMNTINEGKPCWIMTTNNAIGHPIDVLPNFTRDFMFDINTIHSWEFANTAPYIPYHIAEEYAGIYDNFWREYIKDLYSVNNRNLSCYTIFNQRPTPDLLRSFYWFDNNIWCLNEIKDWRLGSYDSVYSEFVKVEDTNNYRLDPILRSGKLSILFEDKVYEEEGEDARGYIKAQSSNWLFADGIIVYGDSALTEILGYVDSSKITIGTRGYKTSLVFQMPENIYGRDVWYMIGVEDAEGVWYFAILHQTGEARRSLSVSPTSFTVSKTGGTQTINITNIGRQSSDNVTITKSDTYFTVSNIIWDTVINGHFTVTVPENNTDYERVGSITVTDASGLHQTIDFEQGKTTFYLNLDQSNCVKCGHCANILDTCPVGLSVEFAADGTAYIANLHNCIGCGRCNFGSICPLFDNALIKATTPRDTYNTGGEPIIPTPTSTYSITFSTVCDLCYNYPVTLNTNTQIWLEMEIISGSDEYRGTGEYNDIIIETGSVMHPRLSSSNDIVLNGLGGNILNVTARTVPNSLFDVNGEVLGIDWNRSYVILTGGGGNEQILSLASFSPESGYYTGQLREDAFYLGNTVANLYLYFRHS